MLKTIDNLRKWQMVTNSRDTGFASLEVILVLIIVGIIGFTGWYVLNAQRATKKSLTTSDSSVAFTRTKPSTISTPTNVGPAFAAIPNEWAEYRSNKDGLRFGYPKEFGVLAGSPLSTADYRDDTKNMQGRMSVVVSPKEGFSVSAYKYGATIKPASDGASWIVSAENPAKADGYKVGDAYKTKNVVVNGGIAIDLTNINEECILPQYLLTLKSSYAVISLPELCPVNMQPISSTNRDAYAKFISEFLASVTEF